MTHLQTLYPIRVIPLTQGKYAYVDACDYDELKRHKWSAKHDHNMWYAKRREKNRTIFMHRVILGLCHGDPRQCDHWNRNGLDNRRKNLRIASCGGNQQNAGPQIGRSSRYKGVDREKSKNLWRARIWVDNKNKSLGCYHDEIEAAHAYDAAARQYFGEFACCNFPEKEAIA